MRQLWFIVGFFLVCYNISLGQTTICEKNSIMYFACYKLNADGTFSYQYIDGNEEQIGIGTYSQTKKELIFTYDSLVSPKIHKTKLGDTLHTINIKCAYILDSFPRLFNPVIYNNTLFFCDSSGSVTIKNYKSGPILIHNYADSIYISPDQDECNHYQIYTHSPDNSFVSKGTVQRLEKKGKYYRRKVASYFDKKGQPIPEGKAWRYIYYNVGEL